MSGIPDNVKQRLCEILKISLDELDTKIKDVTRKHDVDEVVAVIHILTKEGLIEVARDIIEDLLLKRSVARLSDLKIGMKDMTIVGRLEILKVFESSDKYYGVILISDGKTFGQIYIPKSLASIVPEDLALNDIVLVTKVNVASILKNKVLRLYLSENGKIVKLSPDKAKEVMGTVPPPIHIYGVADLQSVDEGDSAYCHIRGILVRIIGEKKFNNAKYSQENLLVLLGDIESFCTHRILCVLSGRAIDEFNKNKPLPGDIIVIHGAVVRKRESRSYVVARNMAVIEKMEPQPISPSEIMEGGMYLFRLYVRSYPRIRTYLKDSGEYRYATFLCSSESDQNVRVVVWNESLLEKVSNLKVGYMVRICGLVRKGTQVVEIHVHKNTGDISVISTEEKPIFPMSKRAITSISDFKPNTFVNAILRLDDVKEIGSEKLAGIVTLTDGLDRIKMLVWDKDMISRFTNLVGDLILVRNARVTVERDVGNVILATTRKTEIIELAKDFKYWIPKEYLRKIGRFWMISDIELNVDCTISGTIVRLDWVGKMYFCKICGGLIVNPEKGICELGHVGDIVEKTVVSIIIDDGFGEINAIIPSSVLRVEEASTGLDASLLGTQVFLSGILKIDYSSGTPVKVFMVEKLEEENGIKFFLQKMIDYEKQLLQK